MSVDFLGLEPLLMTQLEGLTLNGADVDVVPFKELPGNTEPVLRAPSLIVSYDGYKVVQVSTNKAIVKQFWSVAVCVANVRDRARSGAREDAGPLLDGVISKLLGWWPQPLAELQYKRLELADPIYHVEYRERFSLFPLTFSTERPVKGAPVK